MSEATAGWELAAAGESFSPTQGRLDVAEWYETSDPRYARCGFDFSIPYPGSHLTAYRLGRQGGSTSFSTSKYRIQRHFLATKTDGHWERSLLTHRENFMQSHEALYQGKMDSNFQSMPDLTGERYGIVLDRIHRVLQPANYFEIGTSGGESLRYSRCASIAVDPKFVFKTANPVMGKAICALYQMTSDAFFASYNPMTIFGCPVDLAFLDGMHLSEFLLRDFTNVERYCRQNSVVMMHDCLPLDYEMAQRREGGARSEFNQRSAWWTGDVWRVVILLKRRRSELRITVLNAPPTGLVLVTNLDPGSTFLKDNYASLVEEMHSMSLPDITLSGLYAEFAVESTFALLNQSDISARFCFDH